MKKILFIFVVSLLLAGCYSQKELKEKNPTSYVFNANISQIKNSIFQLYENQYINLLF